jgi:hypothetical protein
LFAEENELASGACLEMGQALPQVTLADGPGRAAEQFGHVVNREGLAERLRSRRSIGNGLCRVRAMLRVPLP